MALLDMRVRARWQLHQSHQSHQSHLNGRRRRLLALQSRPKYAASTSAKAGAAMATHANTSMTLGMIYSICADLFLKLKGMSRCSRLVSQHEAMIQDKKVKLVVK